MAINESDFQALLAGTLNAGTETLSQAAAFDFIQYKRTVLPVDGFVFWKPTGNKVTVKGSLHFSQEWLQEADQAIGYTRVIFTAEKQIQEFAQAGKNEIWVATYAVQGENATDNFRYAFSAQTGFYAQASIWHYVGYQIPPALLTQLLDQNNFVDMTRAVVSNSIPLWLGLVGFTSEFLQKTNTVPIYPSFQAAENQPAPYIVVDVLETEALQSTPALGVFGEHSQWCKDTVRVTLYGFQNNEALTFQDLMNQYSLETDNFGIMNMPVIKDVHRIQAEIHGIAMKKEMTVEVSYDQQTTITQAFQLIKSALYNFTIGTLFPVPPEQPMQYVDLSSLPIRVSHNPPSSHQQFDFSAFASNFVNVPVLLNLQVNWGVDAAAGVTMAEAIIFDADASDTLSSACVTHLCTNQKGTTVTGGPNDTMLAIPFDFNNTPGHYNVWLDPSGDAGITIFSINVQILGYWHN